MSEIGGKWGCVGTCRGGRGAGLELGGDVGAAISACVHAVRASERLKEGEGTGERGPRDSCDTPVSPRVSLKCQT
jgi:hypothetical protein